MYITPLLNYHIYYNVWYMTLNILHIRERLSIHVRRQFRRCSYGKDPSVLIVRAHERLPYNTNICQKLLQTNQAISLELETMKFFRNRSHIFYSVNPVKAGDAYNYKLSKVNGWLRVRCVSEPITNFITNRVFKHILRWNGNHKKTFEVVEMQSKMSSVKWGPFGLSHNGLTSLLVLRRSIRQVCNCLRV